MVMAVIIMMMVVVFMVVIMIVFMVMIFLCTFSTDNTLNPGKIPALLTHNPKITRCWFKQGDRQRTTFKQNSKADMMNNWR